MAWRCIRNRSRRASQPRLVAQIRDVIRRLPGSVQTQQGYMDGLRRFMLFRGKRHPEERGMVAGETFLTALGVKGDIASSTQNHAPNAIAFLYRQILRKGFGWLEGIERAKKPARLPVVFRRDEERAVLGAHE